MDFKPETHVSNVLPICVQIHALKHFMALKNMQWWTVSMKSLLHNMHQQETRLPYKPPTRSESVQLSAATPGIYGECNVAASKALFLLVLLHYTGTHTRGIVTVGPTGNVYAPRLRSQDPGSFWGGTGEVSPSLS